ncbi:MAG: glycosyltransferase family 4 protein [Pusillimonas sp.]
MRILLLNFERGWRGGERQTLFCLEQFRAQGHDVRLLARKAQPLALAARQAGFVVHEAGGVAGLVAFLLAHGRRFDVLHAQTANTLTWLAALKPVLGGVVVFTRRTAFPVAASKVAKTLWKWRRTDGFVAISQAAAAEPRRLGLPVSIIRSAAVPVAPDQSRIDALVQRYGLGQRRVVGTAAALTREKDPLTLVRAAHHLRKTHPDVLFLHFGADGDVSFAARQLVTELNLGSHYVFAGFEPGIEALYSAFEVFALSSVNEALGSSVLDAFYQHVPVVATRAGGLAEVLADDRGVLCDIADYRAIAAGIGRFLDEPDLRQRVTSRAYAYALAEHDVVLMGQRYTSLYKRLVSGAG